LSKPPAPSRSRHLRAAAAALALALAAAAPVAAAPAAEGEGSRVATLVPWVQEALAAAPDAATLVATVRADPTSPPPEAVTDLGNPHSPSLEMLAASRPDVVVADAAMHAALAPKLGAAGGKVLLLETGSVDATLAALVELGQAVGAEAAMQQEADRLRAALAERRAERDEKVLALFGAPSRFFVMTERSWTGDLLARLGYTNLGAGVSGAERMPGYVPLSDELVASLQPDVLLLIAHGDPVAVQAAFQRQVEERGFWDGRMPRIVMLDPGEFVANPGPALARRADALVARVEGAAPAVASGGASADADTPGSGSAAAAGTPGHGSNAGGAGSE